jgi:ARG and Rhodanese-Phosphatase-superfamily-associated Protein domain
VAVSDAPARRDDVTVLVGAKSALPIPASCVEQGHWARRSDLFSAARCRRVWGEPVERINDPPQVG